MHIFFYSLYRNLLGNHYAKHLHGYCTGEMIDFMMYYIESAEIAILKVPRILLLRTNLVSKIVDFLIRRFIRLCYSIICLAYLVFCSVVIVKQ